MFMGVNRFFDYVQLYSHARFITHPCLSSEGPWALLWTISVKLELLGNWSFYLDSCSNLRNT